jgi:hypothetical protein
MTTPLAPPVDIFTQAISAPFNVARLRGGDALLQIEIAQGRVSLNLIEAEETDDGDASFEAVLRPWAENMARALDVEGIVDIAFGFTTPPVAFGNISQPAVSQPHAGIDMTRIGGGTVPRSPASSPRNRTASSRKWPGARFCH